MNIVELQEDSRRQFGDYDRLVYNARTFRFEEVYQSSLAIAAELRALGVRPGHRVAVVLPPGPEFHIAFPAIWRIGAVLVPIHDNYSPSAIAEIVRLTECDVVITHGELAATLAAVLPGIPEERFIVARLDAPHPFRDFVRLCETPPRKVPPIWPCAAQDPAVIVFTSGTSGAPKGIVQSHGNIVTLVHAYRDSRWTYVPHCYRGGTTISYASPAHTGPGPFQTALSYVMKRKTLLLDRFDAKAVLQSIEAHGVDLYIGTPTTIIALCSSPELRDHDVSSVKLWFAHGAAFSPAQQAFCEYKLSRRIYHHYGLSECCAAPVHEPIDGSASGADGRPLVGVTIKIADDAGSELAVGEVGEVCIRSPFNALGYVNAAEESRQTFRGEWVHSGDLGRVDHDGNLYVVGRKSEQINQGGFKIMPREVAAVVEAMPEVEACIVAGMPDALFGQVVAAFIKVHAGRVLDRRTVVEHCRTWLSHEKVPRRIFFVAGFPFNASYKIDIPRLVRDHMAALATAKPELPYNDPAGLRSGATPPALVAENPRATRDALLVDIKRIVARLLAVAPHEIRSDVPLMELGVSSLLAVELTDELGRLVNRPLPTTLTFDYPTAGDLADHLSPTQASPAAPRVNQSGIQEPIAVIGMSARFPAAEDGAATLWEALIAGVDATAEIKRWDFDNYYDPTPFTPGKSITRRAAMLSSIDRFDAALFGMNEHEARYADPSHRLALELCWEVLEHAGRAPLGLRDSATGMFLGFTNTAGNVVLRQRYAQPPEPLDNTSSTPAMLAGRVAYFYGFRGPAFVVDTTCSSSLVAFHLACQSLRQRECDIAIAGGVCLLVVPDGFVSLSNLGALSPDGRCKTFDARANGYARGEGGGLFALRRLDDARRDGDRILAIVRGSAINHDGRSTSLTAPNGKAQSAVLRDALRVANIPAAAVSYVEAHGTGTVLGDAIELHSIVDVYGDGRTADQPLVLGSIKTNIGHAEGAAGAAAVAKAILALQHQRIPANCHFDRINPAVDVTDTHVMVPTRAIDWQPIDGRRLAGVSSFGLSGTNAHVILEEADDVARSSASNDDRPEHLLTLSAKTPAALAGLAAKYVAFLRETTESALDICAAAARRRTHLEDRLAVIGRDRSALATKLAAHVAGDPVTGVVRGRAAAGGDRRKLAFLFPGQGEQYVGMGAELAATCSPFRDAIERAARAFAPFLDRPLLEVLAGTHGEQLIHDTRFTQPCLFAVEYALASTWLAWGVVPDVLIGHSLGELVAATIAEAMTLVDAARLVAFRAKLMAAVPTEGMMAAVFAPLVDVEAIVQRFGGEVSIAAINAPNSCVVSGRRKAVAEALALLRARGCKTKQLVVSQAFHSSQVDGILDELEIAATAIPFQPPRLPVISNVDGKPIEAFSGRYWREHARRAVRFADGVAAARASGVDVFVEVGPGSALATLTRLNLGDDAATVVPGLRRDLDAWPQLLEAVGHVYCAGVSIDWAQFEPGARPSADIPTYAFDRQDVSVPLVGGELAPRAAQPRVESEAAVDIAACVEREVRYVLDIAPTIALELDRDLTALGLDSLRSLQLRGRLVKALGTGGRHLSERWPGDHLSVAALLRVAREIAAAPSHASTPEPARTLVREETITAPQVRARYVMRRGEPTQPTYVLLHGYMQSADDIVAALEPIVPATASLLAIDAPMANTKNPARSNELGHFWFPLNAVPSEVAAFAGTATDYVTSVVSDAADAPSSNHVLVGFSQGGTIAALAAMQLPGVQRVVTIFSPLGALRWALDAGTQLTGELVAVVREHDDFLDPAQVRADLHALRAAGVRVTVHVVPGRAHAIDPDCLSAVAPYLVGSPR